MLAETPGVDSQLLRSILPVPRGVGVDLTAGGKPIPAPRSAALVRLSRSQSSWIVALTFHPQRRFGLADMKVMSLARRMVVNRRHHAETCGQFHELVSSLVHCLTTVIEAKAPHLQGHSERVARVAARLAERLARRPRR
jgi:HD-GYP domain-containing protein (c-di-GMP phosphodiesterase class II)